MVEEDAVAAVERARAWGAGVHKNAEGIHGMTGWALIALATEL